MKYFAVIGFLLVASVVFTLAGLLMLYVWARLASYVQARDIARIKQAHTEALHETRAEMQQLFGGNYSDWWPGMTDDVDAEIRRRT